MEGNLLLCTLGGPIVPDTDGQLASRRFAVNARGSEPDAGSPDALTLSHEVFQAMMDAVVRLRAASEEQRTANAPQISAHADFGEFILGGPVPPYRGRRRRCWAWVD